MANGSVRSLATRLFGDTFDRWCMVAALIVGGVVRWPGLSTTDLWFDDAWAAMPAREPIGTALHMVVTTPGYTLANRLVLQLNPEVTWWAQLPALIAGMLGIIAIAALLRHFGASRLVIAIGTAIVVLSPTTVTYSTRVKEYAFDFLLGAVLLYLADRVRIEVSRRTLSLFGAWSVLCAVTSFSTIVAVVGAWLAVGILAVFQPLVRRRILAAGSVTALLSAALVLPFAVNVPSVLNRNWKRRGFLFDPSSLQSARHTLVVIFSGIPHGLLGVPVKVSPTGTLAKLWALTLAVFAFAAITSVVVASVRRTLRGRPHLSRTTPAALVIAVAVLAVVGGRVPLGDGRTDEAIFPALIVLGALVAGPFADLSATALRRLPKAELVVGVIGTALALWFGAIHTARYPTIDLRSLSAKVATTTNGHDRIATVVDGFNAFGWGYYELSPTKVAFGLDHGHIWPQGFHIVSTTKSTVISNNDITTPGQLGSLTNHFDAVWYIGFEQGAFDPYAPGPSSLRPSGTYAELLRQGWRARPGYALLAHHCYAMLLTR